MDTNKKHPYMGAICLGLHDALVSVLGLGTGLTVAMAERMTIVLTAIIASAAAAISMTASQYLAEKTNNNRKHAIRSGIATGMSYITTAFCQILPFMFLENNYVSLILMYIISVMIIVMFNVLVSRARKTRFLPNFLEMLGICSGVTVAAFVIGAAAKIWLGLEI